MTISGSFPWSGFQNHVHFSTRLLVTHFNMASVPTGTEVSVGISTKLTLAGTRNKMNLMKHRTWCLIFWFFFFQKIFQEILDEEQLRRERYFFLDSKRIFPPPQFIPVGRRLTVAGGASCKIPSGDNRTPHVHNPSSSYKIFLNLTEQSWSASLFGLNFFTNRGSWLEFEAFQDHSHCTTGLFTRHLRSTDSPDATWIPLDNCTNSTAKNKINARFFLSRYEIFYKLLSYTRVDTRVYKLQAKMRREFKFRLILLLSPSEIRNRMGFDCVKEEFGSILAPHVQYPSCSGNTFLNLILQSVLSLPKAGNRFTSRFHGCDWFNCRQDHWHSRTGDFIWHIICAEDPAGTSTMLSSFENTIRGPRHL